MSEGLILMAVGMVLVFSALTLLLSAIVLLFRIFERKKAPPAEAASGKPAGEEPDQPPEQEIDGQLIAILTAAATAALGARVRVYRVGFIGEKWSTDHAWVQHARGELRASHRGRSH